MKRLLLISLLLTVASSLAAQKLSVMLQWTPQAQFAGYYVARDMGFYTEEGLDVEILHPGGNSNESSLDAVKTGRAQIVGQQLLQSVIARADGNPLVNILQITQKSGLMCVSNEPISRPEDLDGKKVGRWRQGYAEFCDIMELGKGIDIDWVPFTSGPNLFIFGAVDAILCYSYSEFIALQMAVGIVPEERIIKFADFGYDIPEDGLYVLESYYESNKETIDKFIRATKKGWEYARTHRDEAIEISFRYITKAHIITNLSTQKRMLDEYLDLQINPLTGKADYVRVRENAFNDMIDALLNTGYITRRVEYNEIYR